MAFSFLLPAWQCANFATPPGPDFRALDFAPHPGFAPNSLNCGCAQSAAHSGTHVDSPKDLPSPPPFRASAIRIAHARARGGHQISQALGNQHRWGSLWFLLIQVFTRSRTREGVRHRLRHASGRRASRVWLGLCSGLRIPLLDHLGIFDVLQKYLQFLR
jgi:hypothetical protein